MIYHLRIFLEVISFFAGAIIIFYFYQQNKTSRSPFIQAIIFYLLFFNMINLGEIVIRYIKINMFDLHENMYAVHWQINRLLVMGGVIYTFYNLVFKLINKKLSLRFYIIFFSLSIIMAITHIDGGLEYEYTDQIIHICNLEGFYAFPIVFIIYGIIMLLMRAGNNNEMSLNKAIKMFVIYFLPGYSLYFVLIFFHNLNYLTFPIITFYLNIAMYLWFNKYYWKSVGLALNMGNGDLAGIVQQKYDLTNREKEVISLVIEGKSNKEIKDMLFISSSTVRNHIFVAYKKIGINSRGQLMNLILKLRDES